MVVRYTRELEGTPDGPDAPAMRQALLRWTVDTPDYQVIVCDMLQLPGKGSTDESPISGELNVQMMFGNVAYQIQHGKEGDELTRQVAGVESALRAYTAYVAKKPALRRPVLDALLGAQNAGTLRAQLAPVMEKHCKASEMTPLTIKPDEGAPFLGGFLQESHVVYPLNVGSWSMQAEQRYDEPEWGASVRYQRKGDTTGWIDAYFYPVGVLSTEEIEQMAASERKNLSDTWVKEISGAPMTPLTTFVIPIEGAVVPAEQHPRAKEINAQALDFTYVRNDTTYSSAMVFMVDRLYAIKFRYSAEVKTLTRDQLRRDVESFARQLVPQLDISSTGKCGAPAMFVDGKRADGCAGEEAIQPVVSEGQRELRFEYGKR
ncbi:hypothetical protein [Stenotrophomonas sp. PD6]|uniref:hypothetical protein n=1 Tax=Stenotrophomonas sp. PD6 TaxID=3368612 RepID=UPI003B9DDF43